MRIASRRERLLLSLLLLPGLLPACGSGAANIAGLAPIDLPAEGATTRSTSVAVTADGREVWAVNPDSDSVSVFDVAGDANLKVAEIAVGDQPESVAFDGRGRAFVTNFFDGSLSVLDVASRAVLTTIPTGGAGPYGVASSPNGSRIYVTLAGSGEILVLDAATGVEVERIAPPGSPELRSIVVTNDGDADDLDETVFVADFLARQIPGSPGQGFDDTQEARVYAIPAGGGAGATILLRAVQTGFAHDRQAFCVADGAANDTYCGGPAEPSVAFPNLLHGLAVAGGRLLVPSSASGPKPPVHFETNHHSLLTVIDRTTLTLVGTRRLDADVRDEAVDPSDPLNKVLISMPFAMDVHPSGDRGYLVSSATDQVVAIDNVRAGIPTPATVPGGGLLRIPVGKNPRGIAVNPAGTRAYVLNYVSRAVTVIDLTTNAPAATIPSTALPAAGTPEAEVHLGRALFHSALGPPAPGPTADGRDARFAMSDNGWGSCFQCHPFGLADGVTWIFPGGPRQSIPLHSSFSPDQSLQRILGWSATQSSVQDFEKKIEGVTGGFGLIGPNGVADGVVDHGANFGPGIDALEAYVRSLRTPPSPPDEATEVAPGRSHFGGLGCAGCHGGALWTRSMVTYTLPAALDPAVLLQDGQVVSVGGSPVLHDVGTFDPLSPIEVRGAGPLAGRQALGALGYSPPSLLGVQWRARLFHDGRFESLEELVASGHGGIPASAPVQAELLRFLRSIDASTAPFP
jgi:YVTN family beta-propeller protein